MYILLMPIVGIKPRLHIEIIFIFLAYRSNRRNRQRTCRNHIKGTLYLREKYKRFAFDMVS